MSLHLGHAPWACISLGRLGCSLLARESLYRVLETVYEGASASYLDGFRGSWMSGITSGTKTSERGGCTVPVLALMLAVLGYGVVAGGYYLWAIEAPLRGRFYSEEAWAGLGLMYALGALGSRLEHTSRRFKISKCAFRQQYTA